MNDLHIDWSRSIGIRQTEVTDSYLNVETNPRHWRKIETETMKLYSKDIDFLDLTDSNNYRCE